jgi:O-antigen ligase
LGPETVRWAPVRSSGDARTVTAGTRATETRSDLGVWVFRVALALFLVVAIARMQDVIPGLAPLRPGKLLALPLLAALAMAVPRWQVLAVMRTASAKCVAAIGTLAALSIPLSIWLSNSVTSFVNIVIPSLVLFFATSVGFTDRITARFVILAVVAAVGADALYLLLGAAPMKAGRPYIGSLDPNDSAALFVATLPFAVWLASERRRTRWLGVAAGLLLVAGIVKTGSRGGVVGLIVVALTLIIRATPRRRVAYLIAVAAGVVVFSVAADEAVTARFRTLLAPKEDYNFTERDGRVQIWARGVRYMLTHPFLGVGLNNFETAEGVLSGKTRRAFGGVSYTASHNAFVQVGAELGILGLAAFIGAFWSAGRACRRIQRVAARDPARHPMVAEQETALGAAAYSSLLGTVATIFFLSLAYHPITYFVLAVSVGVVAGSPYRAHGLLRAASPAPQMRFGARTPRVSTRN